MYEILMVTGPANSYYQLMKEGKVIALFEPELNQPECEAILKQLNAFPVFVDAIKQIDKVLLNVKY